MTRSDARYIADQVRNEIIAQLQQVNYQGAAEYISTTGMRDVVKRLADDMADE